MTQAELELDRRLRTRFAAVTDVAGRVPGKPFYRIREATQFPWRTWARLIVFARARHLSLDGRQQLRSTIREFGMWADEVLDLDRRADADAPKVA